MEYASSHTTLILCIAAAIIPIFGVFVWCLADIIKKKWLRLLWAKLLAMLVAAGIIVLLLPYIFLNSALAISKDKVMCESFLKLALQTSILYSVKSQVYLALAKLYYLEHRGQDAIDAFEQSYKYNRNDDAVDNLCSLYTIKGQISYAIAACVSGNHNETAAINSILKNDYEMAYSVINNVIRTSKPPTCLAYAIRAHALRMAGNVDMFEIDMAKAKELCPNAPNIQEIYENENYFHSHYEDLRKEYNFKQN